MALPKLSKSKPARDMSGKLDTIVDDYIEEYDSAKAGWSTFSRALKQSVPGKAQLRKLFLDSLGELRILCVAFDDTVTEKRIDKFLKAYE